MWASTMYLFSGIIHFINSASVVCCLLFVVCCLLFVVCCFVCREPGSFEVNYPDIQ